MTSAVSHISSRAIQVIVGIDTHQDQHVAVAVDQLGIRLNEYSTPATTWGYGELERWARDLGQVCAFGIEGTGSYGAGVARFLTSRGYAVFEVNRPNRSIRNRKGKTDTTDAEMAARAVLAGVADTTPKSGQGEIEMIRMLKTAKDSAIKARTQAINQMKSLVVTAPAELREKLDGLTTNALATRCRSFRPGRLDSPTAAAKYTLRSLAHRFRQLSKEIQNLKAELERLVQTAAPALVNAFGVGPDTAAALLVAAGSNPDRLNSEAAFAALCGVNPIPAGSSTAGATAKPMRQAPTGIGSTAGATSPSQCGTVSHSSRQVAPRSEDPGIHVPPHRRGNEQIRGHPLSQTLRRSRSLHNHPEVRRIGQQSSLNSIGASFSAATLADRTVFQDQEAFGLPHSEPASIGIIPYMSKIQKDSKNSCFKSFVRGETGN